MDILFLRLLLMLASVVANIIFGLLPLIIFSYLRKAAVKASSGFVNYLSLFISLITCFSGGVLLATCVLNMIPEIQKKSDIEMTEASVPMIKQVSEVKEVEKKTKLSLQKNDGTNERKPSIITKMRPHPHSHVVRSVILFYSLSLHSFIEALNYGLRDQQNVLINFFLVTVTHQCVLAFAFGAQLSRTYSVHKKMVVVAVIALSFATPLGAMCGVALGGNSNMEALKETLVLFLEALAAGSFLYVIFFDIIYHQRNNEHNNFMKLLAIFVGFIIVASITLAHLSESKAGNEIHDLHCNN